MTATTRWDERAEFSRFVDGEVLSAIKAGAIGFVEILSQLPSVSPTELLASIDRLAARSAISPQLTKTIRFEAVAPATDRPQGRSLLPLPHPLDFVWRFTADSARDLLNLAANLTPSDGHVLLFGTPGLAVEALSLPVSRQLSFLAEDNLVTQRLVLLNRAVGSPLSIGLRGHGLPQACADAVLVDPPWYIDFIRPMLETAAAACRSGGVVLVSLPPRGTRPSAEAEFAANIRFASRLGLKLRDFQPLAIDYDTPFFETNALAAAGVHAPPRWRRGDLVVLRKVRGASYTTLHTSCGRRNWKEVLVGRMRLFVRADSAVTGSRGLIHLIDGDILPSVSRQDTRRHGAQVWTSGNRIFGTDNPALLFDAALSHTDDAMWSDVQPLLWGNPYERGVLERVAHELLMLAELEAAEEQDSLAVALKRKGLWKSHLTKSYNTFATTISG